MKKLLAALGFFTRIPVWRFCKIPTDYYTRVVDLWSATGLITGGITALSLWGAFQFFPPVLAIIIAFSFRLILTGALHEDGLADFLDGFGGGKDKSRILEIMKDSSIGSYGVLGLIIYYLLLTSCILYIPADIAPLIIFAADPWSKFCATNIVSFLPYARKQEEAKSKLIYRRTTVPAIFLSLILGVLPSLFLPVVIWLALIPPLAVVAIMILYIRYKIGGYTGDCCGATALLCELSFYISAVAIFQLQPSLVTIF